MFVKVKTKEYYFVYCQCHVLEGFGIQRSPMTSHCLCLREEHTVTCLILRIVNFLLFFVNFLFFSLFFSFTCLILRIVNFLLQFLYDIQLKVFTQPKFFHSQPKIFSLTTKFFHSQSIFFTHSQNFLTHN